MLESDSRFVVLVYYSIKILRILDKYVRLVLREQLAFYLS